MRLDILMKINKDSKQKEYLNTHSYWYKYLNRGTSYYDKFYNEYKKYKKQERINKTNNVFESVDTISSIIKLLK